MASFPGGVNTPIWMYGSGTWNRWSIGPWVYNIGIGYLPAKVVWRAANGHIDPATLVYVNDWIGVADFQSPAGISVPSVSLNKRSPTLIAYGVELNWTAITDVNDPRYNWMVAFSFVNTTQGVTYADSIDQHWASADSPAWNLGDVVYGTAAYINDNGTGTLTTTGTKTLGP